MADAAAPPERSHARTRGRRRHRRPDRYGEYIWRDQAEFERLSQQFDLFTANIGYLIHPSLLPSIPPDARIADLGTGTAAFLRKLSPTFPHAQLHGFDNSSDLFPAESNLAHNITLYRQDVKLPFPPELHGTYDLVHVHFFAPAIDPDEWPLVIANASQLLRPGGSIQWMEPDLAQQQHVRSHVSTTVASARGIGERFKRALRDRFDHAQLLPADMKQVGLEEIYVDQVASDRMPETRTAISLNGMNAMFAWARFVSQRAAPARKAKRLGKEESSPDSSLYELAMPLAALPPIEPTAVIQELEDLSEEDLEELEWDAYGDIMSGCYERFVMYIAVAKRPIDLTWRPTFPQLLVQSRPEWVVEMRRKQEADAGMRRTASEELPIRPKP